jgi:c-di-GMP-binding flagellar brake protein YcgR
MSPIMEITTSAEGSFMNQKLERNRPPAGAVRQVAAIERRESPRKTLRLRAALRAPGRPTLNTNTLDISAGGVCVELPYGLDISTECEIDINLDACGTTHLIRLYGRVCYAVQMGERVFRTGMQFVRMRTDVASQLATLFK